MGTPEAAAEVDLHRPVEQLGRAGQHLKSTHSPTPVSLTQIHETPPSALHPRGFAMARHATPQSMVKVLSAGDGVTAKARCLSCNNTRHTERVEITARKFADADVGDIRWGICATCRQHVVQPFRQCLCAEAGVAFRRSPDAASAWFVRLSA